MITDAVLFRRWLLVLAVALWLLWPVLASAPWLGQ